MYTASKHGLAGLMLGLALNTAWALEEIPALARDMDQAAQQQAQAFAQAQGLQSLDDQALDGIQGQAGSLILVDRIDSVNNPLAGKPTDGSADFTFYRMGLDGKLDFNLNMSKLQLGCGGVNDLLTSAKACDIDIDYLSFMGINAAGNAPAAAGCGSASGCLDAQGRQGAASTFQMKRPFIELAIKNDGAHTQREVVGVRVGGQNINGALGIGREYTTSGANLENGGTNCNTGATTGAGVVGCHSGINTVSGFLSLELSAAIRARANLMGFITTDLNTCFGRMTPSQYGCNSSTTPFFVDAGGTRLSTLHVAAAKLNIDNVDLNCAWWNWAVCYPAQLVANGIISEGYGQLKIDMRAVHYLLTPSTENFFLSFQRERVSWPNYSKAPPPSTTLFDICNPAYGQVTSRCSSAYAPTANTGWWLNAPGAKILNINPPDRIDVGYVDAGTALSLLGPEGQLIIDNPKIALARPGNCYGTSIFC